MSELVRASYLAKLLPFTTMNYTAEEIDNMPIEDIEQLAEMLNEDQLAEWADWGYSGECFVRLMGL